MAIDRYSGDYRILESVDEKGRIRSSTEYIGKDYVFTAGKKRAASAAKALAILCAACLAGFLLALIPESSAMRTLYAALPCAFTALPLWFMSTAAWTALRAREPFVHRDADLLNLRLPAACVFAVVLSAAALLGGALGLLLGKKTPMSGDWCFLTGNLICLVCAVLSRRRGKELEAREKGSAYYASNGA